MRSAITFDTLEYMEELIRSGINQDHAEAITKATAKAFIQFVETKELATKKDLQELKMGVQGFMVRCLGTYVLILGGLQTFLHFVK